MSSLITNTSSMIALQTLRKINADLDQTNNRVSTGLRVNSAADNAAYWSIATTTKSDNGALGAVKDALGLGAASVDTANTGLDTVRNALQKIKEKLVTAVAPEADKTKLQSEIASLLDEMKNTADASVISGNNWLSVASAGSSKDIVVSFSRTGGSINIETIGVNLNDYALYEAGTNTGIIDRNRSVTAYTVGTTFPTARTLTDEVFTFTTTVNGSTYSVDIDATTVTNALGSATIGSAHDFKLVMDQAFRDAGVSGIEVDASGTAVTFSSDAAFSIGAATEAAGGAGTVTPTQMGLNAALTGASGSVIVGGVAGMDISSATSTQVQNYLKIVDAALLDLTDASTKAGALTSRIDSQQSFVKALMDANTRAIGTLVDANMEEESTKLKALQTQQQLAIQSLGIANSASQNILALFRN
jgi:flagellin